MRAFGAPLLPTFHHLASHADSLAGRLLDSGTLQLRSCEHLQTSETMFIELFDRVEQVAVYGHQATWTGANSRVTVLRSVSVHPCGGVIRSA